MAVLALQAILLHNSVDLGDESCFDDLVDLTFDVVEFQIDCVLSRLREVQQSSSEEAVKVCPTYPRVWISTWSLLDFAV